MSERCQLFLSDSKLMLQFFLGFLDLSEALNGEQEKMYQLYYYLRFMHCTTNVFEWGVKGKLCMLQRITINIYNQKSLTNLTMVM